jgi:hypothetical protein
MKGVTGGGVSGQKRQKERKKEKEVIISVPISVECNSFAGHGSLSL